MPRDTRPAGPGSGADEALPPGPTDDVLIGEARTGSGHRATPELEPSSADFTPRPVSRRGFLVLGGAAAGLLGEAVFPRAGRGPRAGEALHQPQLTLPVLTENGAKVPIVVRMAHPMEPEHYIRRVEIVNPRDPVPSKGVFELTPANGQVYVAFQARLDDGVSEVTVTAECTRHGRSSAVEVVKVAEGAGGCAAPAPPTRAASIEIRPPAIRIPRLLKGERVQPGDVIDVQVTIRHPSRTGLVVRNGVFVQETEPFFVRELLVYHGTELASRFSLTAAWSDNPLVTFRLRPWREEPVRVVFTNSRGQRFEATHPIRFG